MRKLTLVTLIILILNIVGCKRFDSDQLNRQLIQGVWEQVEVAYPDEVQQALVVESLEGVTFLEFRGDSCIETMEDINKIRNFSYQIKNYILKLDEEGVEPSYLEITKLTEDSLILRSKYQSWRYISKDKYLMKHF